MQQLNGISHSEREETHTLARHLFAEMLNAFFRALFPPSCLLNSPSAELRESPGKPVATTPRHPIRKRKHHHRPPHSLAYFISHTRARFFNSTRKKLPPSRANSGSLARQAHIRLCIESHTRFIWRKSMWNVLMCECVNNGPYYLLSSSPATLIPFWAIRCTRGWHFDSYEKQKNLRAELFFSNASSWIAVWWTANDLRTRRTTFSTSM